MRKRARVDANQRAIVKALRQAGCSVRSVAAVGNGFPDLCAGRAGRNYLLEVKDGSKAPSERALTEDEKDFHQSWSGQKTVVESIDEALRAVGVKR